MLARDEIKDWGEFSTYIEISTRSRVNFDECIEECACLIDRRYGPKSNYKIKTSRKKMYMIGLSCTAL